MRRTKRRRCWRRSPWRSRALLAGKAVGAPFVGAVAATLVISEVLRLLHGGVLHELIDLDLKAPEYRKAVPVRNDFSALNPGYVLAAPC
jgi:hypothetical protein